VIYLRTRDAVCVDANVFGHGMIRFDSHNSLLSIGPDILLWGGSFLLVVTLHVVSVVGFQPDRTEGEAAGDPSVVIELDAISAAPIVGQSEQTPGPEQIETDEASQASVAQQEVPEQSRKEKQEASVLESDTAKTPDPEVALPDLPKKPEANPDQQQQKQTEAESAPQMPSEAHLESAPTSAPQAQAALAPDVSAKTGAVVEDAVALVTWRATLAAHVQRFKRYPAEAVGRHVHGTTMVRFTMDRKGAIVGAEIVSRSGVEVLDRESLSLIARAAPLPPPPHHIAGSHFTFTIPIRFHPQH
jgi:protein TonB